MSETSRQGFANKKTRERVMYIGLIVSAIGIFCVFYDTVIYDNKWYWMGLIPVSWIGWGQIVAGQIIFWAGMAIELWFRFTKKSPDGI